MIYRRGEHKVKATYRLKVERSKVLDCGFGKEDGYFGLKCNSSKVVFKCNNYFCFYARKTVLCDKCSSGKAVFFLFRQSCVQV